MVYKELTIIFRDSTNMDDEFGGTYKTTYKNVSLQITNQHMILDIHKKNEDGDTYIESHVFNLESIKSYKRI